MKGEEEDLLIISLLFFSSPLEHFSLILVSPPFLSVGGVGYFVLCLALIVIISSFITPSLNKVNGTCP
jgi:hypothetical protein